MKTYQYSEWKEEAARLFGPNPASWKFQCPICNHVQCGQDFIDAGVEGWQSKVFYSCIGRWINGEGTLSNKKAPCNYTLGGLLTLNKAEVIDEEGRDRPVFEFATA